MVEAELTIAAKHIKISIQAKQIAMNACKDCDSYIATYTSGTSGQAYQRLEEESGEEFWSLKAWTPPPHRRLKDPDLIVTRKRQVAFLVEVKWGIFPGRASTDLLINPTEWWKMARLFREEALCRVRGPAVENGNRYRSPEFRIERDYYADSQTRWILVSDFHLLGKALLNEFLATWRNAKSGFLIADIHARLGEIPSLNEILAGKP